PKFERRTAKVLIRYTDKSAVPTQYRFPAILKGGNSRWKSGFCCASSGAAIRSIRNKPRLIIVHLQTDYAYHPPVARANIIRTGCRVRLRDLTSTGAVPYIAADFLPQEFQAELNLTGCTSGGRSCDHTSAPIITATVIHQTQTRQSEVRMVCDVEEFGAELNSELLRNRRDRRILHQGII